MNPTKRNLTYALLLVIIVLVTVLVRKDQTHTMIFEGVNKSSQIEFVRLAVTGYDRNVTIDTLWIHDDSLFYKEVKFKDTQKVSVIVGPKTRQVTQVYLVPDRTFRFETYQNSRGHFFIKAENQYPELIAEETLKKRTGAQWRKRYNRFVLDWEGFKNHLDSTANVLISRLDSLKLEHPDMHKNYYALKMAELKMAKKSDYLSYKRVHEEHQKKRLNLGADYQAAVSNILAEVEPNNEKAMINHVYQSIVFNYLRHKTYEKIIKNKPFESIAILSEEAAIQFVDIVSDEVNDASRIGKYIHMFVYRNIEFLNPNIYDRLYGAIDKVVVDVDIKKEIYDRMEHFRQLSPGVRAPQFELADIKGGHVDLDQLKGKYVLIDVWATWCGPCKAEHPYWEQLIEDYNKYDIHFVSVSIDKDKAAWEKMVKEESMKGVHLHGGTKSKAFQEDYLINGIPHYILIDPDGNIVRNGFSRPSDTQTRNTLDDLLTPST